MSGLDVGVPVEQYARPDYSRDPGREAGFLLPLPVDFPRNVTTTAYALSLLIFAGQGRLFGLTGYDANSSGEFVQVFEGTAVPSTGAVPAIVISTGTAASNFGWYQGTVGRWFRHGCIAVTSSTGPTFTAAATANMWLDAQYVQYD